MDLSTTYLGMRLPNPFLIGSGPLCDDLDHVRALEDAGASLLVLRSLYEEEITGAQMDALTGPQLRKPRGGYLHARTRASASSRVFTIGQMTPYAPASRIFMRRAGSFQGTRASGITEVVEMLWSMVTATW